MSESGRWTWLEQLLQDLRFAFRQIFKAPGFTATVVLTLALGIGACTVIFTAVNTTLLHPLNGPEADRTVIVHETQLPRIPQAQLSPPAFLDLESQAKSFEFLSAWTYDTVNLTGNGEPLRLVGGLVSLHTFRTWGSDMELGREFVAEDFEPGKSNVVVLSHPLWQATFGGARDVVGRTLLFDGMPYTVVGVMSDRFARLGSDLQFWTPLVFTADQRADKARGQRYLQVTGILRRDATLAQAQAELNVFAARFAQQYGATNKGWALLVRALPAYINRTLAPLLYVLLGAVGCVLLIACANVANLLLARATARQQEISIRAALGAGRGRIVRQLLVESVVLAVLGGAGGLILADWGLRFIRTFAPTASTDLGRLAYAHLDAGMLVFTLAFSVATGLLFGLAPAWLASRSELGLALKQGGRGSGEGAARSRLRDALVVAEVAMALVLLAGAGLLIRSFSQIASLDPGFAPEHAAAMTIPMRAQKYGKPEARVAFADALLTRLRTLPGVEAAAFSVRSPFDNPGLYPFAVDGQALLAPTDQPQGAINLVTPEYFRALGIRLLDGRAFTDRDNAGAPPVVVINQSLANQYFAHDNPIGRHLVIGLFGNPAVPYEIVGIAADVMQGVPGQKVPPQFYLPWLQLSTNGVDVFVRTRGDPAALLPQLKAQVYAVDRDQPVGVVRTVGDWVDLVLARQRLTLRLLAAFAAIALTIAVVGIYGVMAYSVSQRTVEFGLRMALGAGRGDVLRQVLRRGMTIVGLGLGAGLAAALLLGRFVETMLYDTSPRDPLTLAAIMLVLLFVSFLACLIPAYRATKVDPMTALRCE